MKVASPRLRELALVSIAFLAGAAASAHSNSPLDRPQPVAKTYSLNDTGLTVCVDTSTWLPTSCAGTGQDGEFGRDLTHNDNSDGLAGFSFVKVCNNGKQAGQLGCKVSAAQGDGPHDWACTKDLVTGLVWELRTSDDSIRDANRSFTNFGIDDPADTGGLVAAMNAQALCGATDWRMPTVTELFGLVEFDQANNNVTWFPDLAVPGTKNWLWTSETYMTNPPNVAWYVDTGWPETMVNDRNGDGGPTSARVVHGTSTHSHLVAKGAEVHDTLTHLIWRRCVEGMTWQKPNCVGTPTLLYWSDALAYANAVAASTGVGWRLPNIKELQSISVLANTPTIDPVMFPQTPAFWTWSSSGWGEFELLYTVEFGRGFARRESGVNSSNFAVRLVRDAD